MATGLTRTLRTFWAPGFENTSSDVPSQVNQIGTMCGAPSGRTVDSQTTGSSCRNRSSLAAWAVCWSAVGTLMGR